MDARDALRMMIDNSGMTPAEIGQKIGKSRTYIYTLRTQKSNPGIDTYARLAHEFGYRIMLKRSDGEEIELYSRDDASAHRSNSIRDKRGEELVKAIDSFASDPQAEYRHYNAREATEEESRYIHELVERLESDPEAMARYQADFAKRRADEEAARTACREREEAFFKKPGEKPSDSESTKPGDSDLGEPKDS